MLISEPLPSTFTFPHRMPSLSKVLWTLWRSSVADLRQVLNTFSDDFLAHHRVSPQKASVLSLLRICRTSELGAHANVCTNCGHLSMAYNSCRNRHCPLCQSIKREMWRFDRGADLLNTHYFHAVFTVPHELNDCFMNNQRIMYDILMKSSAETLLTLSRSSKYLGAQIGATAILHTWGQTLSYHPHVHFIIPGGGLCLKSGLWKPTGRKFFIPVKVLSVVFRAIFLKRLKEIIALGTITVSMDFHRLISVLYEKNFVTFIKDSLDSPIHVINYLCQYTHRVAISNHRILSVGKNSVSFKYKDYSQGAISKIMTLSGSEFIRRFLLHVLPKGFSKIRHYGILAGRNRPTKLETCRKLMRIQPSARSRDYSTAQFIELFLPHLIKPCPYCNEIFDSLKPT